LQPPPRAPPPPSPPSPPLAPPPELSTVIGENPGGAIVEAVAEYATDHLGGNESGGCVVQGAGLLCTEAFNFGNGSVSITLVTDAAGAIEIDAGGGTSVGVDGAAGQDVAITVFGAARLRKPDRHTLR